MAEKSSFESMFSTQEADNRLKMLELFYQLDDTLSMKTDLTRDEIIGITSLEYITGYIKKKWNIDLRIIDFTQKYKAHKISENRQGRTEAITVMKQEDTQEKQKSRVRRLLGI